MASRSVVLSATALPAQVMASVAPSAILVTAAVLLASSPARADADDPPALVGRVAYAEGPVSFAPLGAADWSPGYRQLPVAQGEAFRTDRDARLGLQVGPTRINLDQNSLLAVVRLDYGIARYRLDEGVADVRLWRMPEGGVTIVTPQGEVRLLQPGVYRIAVFAPEPYGGDRGRSEVVVLAGLAGLNSPLGEVDIRSGQGVRLADADRLELVRAAPQWIDTWARRQEAADRDREELYARADDAAYGDLDAYGRWETSPDQDRIWYPEGVPPDWAPYRYGHWADVAPWGWTWIDDQPWGFSPFHYGRWIQVGGRWGWTPGRPSPRPVYAPALVAFIGGVSVRLGGGGPAVGWVPLAPGEVYRPSYHVSTTYVRQVNVTNVHETVINQTIINNRVINQGTNNYRNAPAATVVPARSFGAAQPVQVTAVHVTPADLGRPLPAVDINQVAPHTAPSHNGGPDGRPTPFVTRPAAGPVAPSRPDLTQPSLHDDRGDFRDRERRPAPAADLRPTPMTPPSTALPARPSEPAPHRPDLIGPDDRPVSRGPSFNDRKPVFPPQPAPPPPMAPTVKPAPTPPAPTASAVKLSPTPPAPSPPKVNPPRPDKPRGEDRRDKVDPR